VDARADEVRRYLKERPEKEVVLVSHLGFLHHLTEDWEGEVGMAPPLDTLTDHCDGVN